MKPFARASSSLLLGAAFALAACEADVAASALDVAPEPVLPTRERPRRLLDWGLASVGGELRTVTERIDATSDRYAECVPLADGDVLVSTRDDPGPRNRRCFLRLHPGNQGWEVREVGMQVFTGCGFGHAWGENPVGTVALDVRAPRALACRVEVVGENYCGEPAYMFNSDFWIDPYRDSLELRGRMAHFRGGPALR